ncbi:MAG: GerMN domain-containing protein [Acidimicrobiales bacterium]|nr:GerMN domain-containing protein [Acidimicrobiales bacterium]|tara:strand:+ start:8094 stop:8735 length:642 start_codon:yes stop_codon:yes gene_type:complete
MSRTRTPVAAVALLGLSLLATACGITVESQPRSISAPIPDALQPDVTTTIPSPDTEQVEIFLARSFEDRMQLAKVTRDIDPDGTVNTILEQVLAGPNLEEQEEEYISPFIEGSAIIGTALNGTLLEIYLDSLDGFPQDDSTSNRLAYAMLVCTATELIVGAEIQLVKILVERDGDLIPVNIPVSDGELTEEGAPVYCANYATFDPKYQPPEEG